MEIKILSYSSYYMTHSHNNEVLIDTNVDMPLKTKKKALKALIMFEIYRGSGERYVGQGVKHSLFTK